MATRTYEDFSLSHAAILNGPADRAADNTVTLGVMSDWGDLYGVRTGTVTPDSGNYDNTGDDFVLSSWFWMNFATVTVESGYIPFDLVARMTGNEITRTGTGANAVESVPLWDENSVNVAPRPMLIRVPSKDSDGIPRVLDFVLYRVNFSPISFTGPAYKAGLVVSYSGRAVLSDKDERGNQLAKRAVGRLVSAPQTNVPADRPADVAAGGGTTTP